VIADSNVAVTIAIFLAAQTGALIFYAGVMITMLRSHEKRLDNIEAEQRAQRLLPQPIGKEAVAYERF
jgi:sensor domain CHASE-containing protein